MDLLRGLGCEVEIRYPSNAGGLGRIINLARVVEMVSAGIAARAQMIGADETPGRIKFSCPGSDPAIVELGTGPTLSITLEQGQLLQLLMGYLDIDEPCTDPAEINIRTAAMIRKLFPRGYPHMSEIDHF